MSSNSFKYVTYKLSTYKSQTHTHMYIDIDWYDFASGNPQD